MKKQIYNFNAGPSALPKPALEKAQQELTDFNNSGMSVMELSHRSKEYDEVHNQAKQLLKELLNIPEGYRILFLQGGASLQFSMIPFNFLKPETIGNYILTGVWSEKALKEAQILGDTRIAASTKIDGYRTIPPLETLDLQKNDAYVHLTSNNTIYGTQWRNFPQITHAPLIADMSSDILSRSLPIEKFGLIYAGAQKNLGPSGLTVVIIREDLLNVGAERVPTMLRYDVHADTNSLYNTPPTFAIYMLNQVLTWASEEGGIVEIENRNKRKAKMIYQVIDESDGFYRGHAESDSRSNMNITFTLPTDEDNQRFLAQAQEYGFVGLGAIALLAVAALRRIMQSLLRPVKPYVSIWFHFENTL